MIRKSTACCFSGHRILAKKYQDTLPDMLETQIRSLIAEGMTDFITGGALGFDTLAAQTVLKLREEFPHIRLILALPCKDQEKSWPKPDQDTYHTICHRADAIHYTAESYSHGCMMRRNRFMVDHSVGCVFYLTNHRSGTYQTVSYAMEQNLKLYNILAIQPKNNQ